MVHVKFMENKETQKIKTQAAKDRESLMNTSYLPFWTMEPLAMAQYSSINFNELEEE